MLLLYCADPLAQRRPDAAYAAEVAAAERNGLAYALLNFEALIDQGDAARATQAVPAQSTPTLAIYRGWMLRPAQYAELYAALLERNVRLINDPPAYRHCHYLPESYAQIAHRTPRTVWLPLAPGEAPTDETLGESLNEFGERPLIVKDYVKSRKHEWSEACFVPSAADIGHVQRVVRRFLELQGGDLAEGLVFREYVAFAPLGTHPRSGMPLTREYRIFWLDDAPLLTAPYWGEGAYAGDEPPVATFQPVAAQIDSRFFTMDVAQRADDGGWQIVELGDGQVAGLPERADVNQFYQGLARTTS